jgi:predicted transcriptional regulator of viral defense system
MDEKCIFYVRNAGADDISNTQGKRGGLSVRKSQLLSRLAAEGYQIILIDDIKTTLAVAPNVAREIASRLTEKR